MTMDNHLQVEIVSQDQGIMEIVAQGQHGPIEIITGMIVTKYTLILHGLHIDGPGAGRSSIKELKAIAQLLGKQYSVKEVVVLGGRRTSGASVGQMAKNPGQGRVPKPLIIKIK